MTHVPRTYAEWEHCITVECGIRLTPGYVAARIAALEDRHDFQPHRFIDRWGAAHHVRTLEWFRETAGKLAAA